ncbi:TonB-dependent siderophore receptor [Acidobacterium sp. S8]|uniref:TonB-dependent siderophore receptor n=1 Tax=Acidobacterium sp. S8 TaxID=1641854 RepID=UPI00131B924C|nr:TonB-dependent siderophore receptor [Acidobacterium sp. S8]
MARPSTSFLVAFFGLGLFFSPGHKALADDSLLFDSECHVDASAPSLSFRLAITDNSGAAIPQAAIELSCGSATFSAQTGGDGATTIRLHPGTYHASVRAVGFSTVERLVTVDSVQNATTTVALNVGSAAETVSVTADTGFVPYSSDTGSKTDARLIEVPQSISVINERELESRNVITVNEALRYTPGVEADEYGVEQRYDWMKIRGFTSDTYGVFRDGMRWNSLAGKMDPYELESIEVLKGPSSVLYGQAPPGGLVNLVTKRPTSEAHREVEAQFGSYDRRQLQFDFGGPIDANQVWRYRLLGLLRNSDTQTDYTPDNRRLIAPSLTWHTSEKTNITAMGDWQHDKTRWSQFLPASGTLYNNNPDGIIPVNTFVGEPGWEHVYRDQASLGYSADHVFGDGWNIHQNYRYQHVNFDGSTVYGTGFVDGSNDMLTRLAYTMPKWDDINTIDTRAVQRYSTLNWEHTILAGYDFVHLNERIKGAYGVVAPINVYQPVYGAAIPELTPDTNTNELSQQHGVYLQDQVKYKRHLVMTLGGREDWAIDDLDNFLVSNTDHQNDSKFTGRAGVTYVTDIGIAPYYSYSTSFQPTTGSTTFDGKLFLPSLGTQHEAGLKFQPRTWSSFITASYFNIDQTNVLTTDPAHPLYSVQTGEVRSRGAELEGVANLSRGWNLHAGYSLVSTAITKASAADSAELGKWFPQTPRNQTSFLADYTVPGGKLSGLGGNFGVRFVGESAADTLNTIFIPNYTLLDGALRFNWRSASLAVNATNLTDKRYVATCTGLAYCGYGFARNVIGTVKYNF